MAAPQTDGLRTYSGAVALITGGASGLGAALARMECAVALDEVRVRWPNFIVDEDGLERVQMTNVAGFSRVPVTV